ncbi:hypothetical protein [Streptomyces sp. NPDC059371]|uniref:hypothetical protein n=1 Tax=Streptomyces sp. NPDC059371 TaxID=3346812 RepID=UPI0036B9C9DE
MAVQVLAGMKEVVPRVQEMGRDAGILFGLSRLRGRRGGLHDEAADGFHQMGNPQLVQAPVGGQGKADVRSLPSMDQPSPRRQIPCDRGQTVPGGEGQPPPPHIGLRTREPQHVVVEAEEGVDENTGPLTQMIRLDGRPLGSSG